MRVQAQEESFAVSKVLLEFEKKKRRSRNNLGLSRVLFYEWGSLYLYVPWLQLKVVKRDSVLSAKSFFVILREQEHHVMAHLR